MKSSTLVLIGAGAVGAYLLYRYLPGGVKTAAEAVNPLNQNNIFAEGSNAVTSALVGHQTTLGGEIYSATHVWGYYTSDPTKLVSVPFWTAMLDSNFVVVNNPATWSPPGTSAAALAASQQLAQQLGSSSSASTLFQQDLSQLSTYLPSTSSSPSSSFSSGLNAYYDSLLSGSSGGSQSGAAAAAAQEIASGY